MRVLGKYVVDGLIAEGGMARIYRAKTEGVGGVEKAVALKCLKESMSESDTFVQMLMDEARISVRMTHKNIGQVYGLEHDGDIYFMVMELVDGINLAQLSSYLFGVGRVFPIEAAVFIASEVCAGLSYAHRMTDDSGQPLNIVHRDVNPQNICISREGEVKLIDFGIAKARRASSETQVGTIKGKFNYMSPEQARGERVDQRTDVFALGAVLYEILCGHMLYPLSLDDAKLRTKVRMADFVPIENYIPNIPETLRKIIAKALARDINTRFASSRDFLLALTRFFHDSCKVYDSLNLSMLMDAYYADSPQTPQPDIIKADVTEIGMEGIRMPDGDTLFSSDSTAVMSAAEARDLADADMQEDSKTSIYQKPDFSQFDNLKQDLAADSNSFSQSLSRSIDLDVPRSNTATETLMVPIKSVSGRFSISDTASRLFGRITSVNEKTLIVIALGLAITLIFFIVLFAVIDDSKDNVQSEPVSSEKFE